MTNTIHKLLQDGAIKCVNDRCTNIPYHGRYQSRNDKSTFTQVLCTMPDCGFMEIMAWKLSGFPSGSLPILHIFLVLRNMQSCHPTANLSGPLLYR